MSLLDVTNSTHNETRCEHAQTKLTPRDRLRLNEAASEMDVTPSEFIRACVLMGLDDVDEHRKRAN